MPAEPHAIEVRDGMHVTWDAPIEMDDGLVLRADLFVVFRVFGPDLKEVTLYSRPGRESSLLLPIIPPK